MILISDKAVFVRKKFDNRLKFNIVNSMKDLEELVAIGKITRVTFNYEGFDENLHEHIWNLSVFTDKEKVLLGGVHGINF